MQHTPPVLDTPQLALDYAMRAIPHLGPVSATPLPGGYCNFVYRIHCVPPPSATSATSNDATPSDAPRDLHATPDGHSSCSDADGSPAMDACSDASAALPAVQPPPTHTARSPFSVLPTPSTSATPTATAGPPSPSPSPSPSSPASVILKYYPPFIATNPSAPFSQHRCKVEIAALRLADRLNPTSHPDRLNPQPPASPPDRLNPNPPTSPPEASDCKASATGLLSVRIPRLIHADEAACCLVMEDAGEGLVSLLDALTRPSMLVPGVTAAEGGGQDRERAPGGGKQGEDREGEEGEAREGEAGEAAEGDGKEAAPKQGRDSLKHALEGSLEAAQQLLPQQWPGLTVPTLSEALHRCLASMSLHGSDPAFNNQPAWEVLAGYFGTAARLAQEHGGSNADPNSNLDTCPGSNLNSNLKRGSGLVSWVERAPRVAAPPPGGADPDSGGPVA